MRGLEQHSWQQTCGWVQTLRNRRALRHAPLFLICYDFWQSSSVLSHWLAPPRDRHGHSFVSAQLFAGRHLEHCPSIHLCCEPTSLLGCVTVSFFARRIASNSASALIRCLSVLLEGVDALASISSLTIPNAAVCVRFPPLQIFFRQDLVTCSFYEWKYQSSTQRGWKLTVRLTCSQNRLLSLKLLHDWLKEIWERKVKVFLYQSFRLQHS